LNIRIVKPDFIQENISLKPHNSFRFDVLAAFYAQIFNIDQLKSAIEWANSNSIPISMIGEGSNLLLTGDLDSLVLINCLKGVSLSRTDACVEVLVSAGENWHEVVTFAIENDLSGIENLALIG